MRKGRGGIRLGAKYLRAARFVLPRASMARTSFSWAASTVVFAGGRAAAGVGWECWCRLDIGFGLNVTIPKGGLPGRKRKSPSLILRSRRAGQVGPRGHRPYALSGFTRRVLPLGAKHRFRLVQITLVNVDADLRLCLPTCRKALTL
jgi:hypothetical protein